MVVDLVTNGAPPGVDDLARRPAPVFNFGAVSGLGCNKSSDVESRVESEGGEDGRFEDPDVGRVKPRVRVKMRVRDIVVPEGSAPGYVHGDWDDHSAVVEVERDRASGRNWIWFYRRGCQLMSVLCNGVMTMTSAACGLVEPPCQGQTGTLIGPAEV